MAWALPRAPESDAEASRQAARPARILCVDDEPAVLTILSRALGSRFEIVTMDDPVAALSLLERSADFSVVISDLRMPQMDGADFLARARRIAPNSSRLALTGCLDRELADQVFGVLTKPCPLRLLHESVTAAVQHHLLLSQPKSRLPEPLPHPVSLLSTAPPNHDDMISGIRSRQPELELEPGGARELQAVEWPGRSRPEASSIPAGPAGEAPGALTLLRAVADKFFLLGQAAKAERVVSVALEDLAVRARHGLFPPARDAEAAVALALRLAEHTRDPEWIDYVFRLYLDLRRPLLPAAIERLHALVREVPGSSHTGYREYVEMLRAAERGFGAAEQFSIRRIEGLDPLYR